MPLDPTLALAAALLLAAIFGSAGPAKLMARDAFAGVVANYRLLPDPLVTPVALVLPCLEMPAHVRGQRQPVRVLVPRKFENSNVPPLTRQPVSDST